MGQNKRRKRKAKKQQQSIPTLGMEGKNKNLPVVSKQRIGAPVPAQGTLAFINQKNGVPTETNEDDSQSNNSKKNNKKRRRKRTKNNKYRVPEAAHKAALKKDTSQEQNEGTLDSEETTTTEHRTQHRLPSNEDDQYQVDSPVLPDNTDTHQDKEGDIPRRKRPRPDTDADGEPIDYVSFGETVTEPPALKGIVGGRGAHDIVGTDAAFHPEQVHDEEKSKPTHDGEEQSEMDQLREAVMRRYRMQRERARQRQRQNTVKGRTLGYGGANDKRRRTVGTYNTGFDLSGWEE